MEHAWVIFAQPPHNSIQTQCHWKLASRQHWQETLSVRWFFRKHYYPTHQLRRWNQSDPSIIVEALREIGSPVAQTFQNKFSVRAKTFHKTSFCCKNSLRSEINPYHFESPLSGEFFNFIFLQEKDGWQMSPLSTSFPTHWHLIECFSVVLFHFHQNAKEKVNVSVGSINPN